MNTELLHNLDNPAQLESMYRRDKELFKTEFYKIYPQVKDNPVAACWYERLNFHTSKTSNINSRDIWWIIITCLVSGLIANMPYILHIEDDHFYQRNAGFIVFPALIAYFIQKNKLQTGKIIIAVAILLVSAIFINLFPADTKSDTLLLSCIHLPIVLWAVFGFAFLGNNYNDLEVRQHYLQYNGDLVIISGIMLIAGGLLTAITINLFTLIDVNIEDFYFKTVVIFLLPAVPIVGNFLIQRNPQLVGKISSVIAKIFSPLVLIMLIIYTIAMIYVGRNPYNNREFLMVFNLLLIGVMAIICFSVSEAAKNKNENNAWILFLLSVVTIVVNGIALSAIIFRLSSWGATPNRIAVLGANVLMLLHLLLISFQLFKTIRKQTEISAVGKTIAVYLPVYIVWTAVVVFIFPLLFGFK